MVKLKLNQGLAAPWAVILAVVLAFVIVPWLTAPALANETAQETEAYCLSCHSNPELSMTLLGGEKLSLFINEDMLKTSAHSATGIECEACHTEITTYPHPDTNFQTTRELSRSYYAACQKCHASNYKMSQDSMHSKVAAQGNLDAPICTDCHGAHNVRSPNEPRALISDTCGKCHVDINEAYRASVHGGVIVQENNPDVPVCTNCHGVHNIQDPRTALFRIETPDLCAGCHADKALMAKYGLSTDVYSLYKTSWHGVDISVFKSNWPTIWHDSAVCTDCHGVHDILATQDERSMVNPTHLLTTCQKCHPGAGPNWTDSWTGHNRISLQQTPFLFYVNSFYTTLVPVVLWSSILYVILQIIRSTVDRVRSSLP